MSLASLKVIATSIWCITGFCSYLTQKGMFGKTNSEVSEKYDTLITPISWAFSIWGIIFIGEAVGLITIFTLIDDAIIPKFENILYPFIYACVLQCVWCLCFSLEFMFISAAVLSAVAYNLMICTEAISLLAFEDLNLISICSQALLRFNIQNPAWISLLSEIVIAYPIRMHFSWTLVASLVNWNMFLVSLNYREYEIFSAYLSVWLAAGIGFYRAIFCGDAIFPAVLCWTYVAMEAKVKNKPQEAILSHSDHLRILDILSRSFEFLSMNMLTLVFVVVISDWISVYLNLGPYKVWIVSELSLYANFTQTLCMFLAMHAAIVQTFITNAGWFVWR